MAGRIIAGTLLVLSSWAVATLVLSVLGRWAALLIQPDAARAAIRRASLWWGLLVAIALTLMINLIVPLASPAAAAVLLCAAVLLAGVAFVFQRSRRPSPRIPATSAPRSVIGLVAALGTAAVYLAFKAIGPVTNYDTGLYHLGAIKYSGDFSTIPGLATLFFPFGYNNAQFPLAALLGNGPWDGIGYRLLNGLLVLLVMADVVTRLLSRRYTWGTFVLVVGLGATLIPLIALADFWVTSPTSDTAILLLTLVSSAYLADFLSSARERALNASVVAVSVTVMVAMRPTMVFLAVASAVIVAISLVRHRSWPGPSRRAWVVIVAGVLLLGALQVARDRLLSGWLLYPLSVASFDVPWRALDPTGWRDATLAAARDATAADQYVVAHSWGWIPVWIGRLWSQWETYFFLLTVIVTVITWLLARRYASAALCSRCVAAVMVPSLVAVVAWFTLSPPSFRFIWGPLFCLAFIPLGAGLRALHGTRRHVPRVIALSTPLTLTITAAVVLIVTCYSVVARSQLGSITEPRAWTLGPITLPYAIAPVPLPEVVPVPMRGGLVLYVPSSGDQCWDNYPLCSYSMGDDVALRGPSIQDGFFRQ